MKLALGFCLVVSVAGQGILERQPPPFDRRVSYGADPNQFGDLRLPSGGKGEVSLVVMIHGGFWRKAYGLEHTGHLCAALTAQGAATFNIEYRRIGQDGGGWPGTFDDALAAVHKAKTLVAATTVTVVGHSAGGHLALWVASREPVTRVVSLAGVADLERAWQLRLSRGVVGELLGPNPEKLFAATSPIELIPLSAPQVLLHGSKDDIVPLEISKRFAEKAGRNCRLVILPDAGHFEPIDPESAVWPQVAGEILGPRTRK